MPREQDKNEKKSSYEGNSTEKTFKTGLPEIISHATRKRQYIEFTSHNHRVAFDAFITNMSIGVGSAAQPYSNSFIGDGNLFMYNGAVTRKISLSFKVVAASKQNAIANLQKLSLLHLMVYNREVEFEGTDETQSQPNEISVRFMNILQGASGRTGESAGVDNPGLREGGSSAPAHVSELNYEFDMDAGFIEERRFSKIYPKVVNVNLNFIMLAEGIGWGPDGQPNARSTNFPFGMPYDANNGSLVVTEEAGAKTANSTSYNSRRVADIADRGTDRTITGGGTDANGAVSNSVMRSEDADGDISIVGLAELHAVPSRTS